MIVFFSFLSFFSSSVRKEKWIMKKEILGIPEKIVINR